MTTEATTAREPLTIEERAAYDRWRDSARKLQATKQLMMAAEREHRDAFVALGNLVAPLPTEGG